MAPPLSWFQRVLVFQRAPGEHEVAIERSFIASLGTTIPGSSLVLLRGWANHIRIHAKTSFLVLGDCTGEIQCVSSSDELRGVGVKVDDAVEVVGRLRPDPRAKGGFEVDVEGVKLLNPAARDLPFTSEAGSEEVGIDIVLAHRPLSLRARPASDIFRVQAAILSAFRRFLVEQRFTEIVSSKLVAGGTEGGANLFEVKYFDRTAYLAQSPQFYKEYGVAGFERVFETGHVYRAEPHATSRHLTEYYSLDLEMGFIDGPEEVIELERQLLTSLFNELNERYGEILLRHRGAYLPSMKNAPVWEFEECLERLRAEHGRTDLVDDLDPEAERQLCRLAERDHGAPAVFVLGFPLAARPFYTHPRGSNGAAQSFDLLFQGLEITTGGQRLHTRESVEAALKARGMDPEGFASHLRMFELGMPPHGGLAIGLERLTAQILNRGSVKETSLFPRDRYRLTP